MHTLRTVPPAPEITSYLVNEYRRKWKERGFTFRQFLAAAGYDNPAHDRHGMDEGGRFAVRNGEVMRIDVPHTPLTGDLNVIVLLAEFPDQESSLPREDYEELLFSRNTFLTGSMADYYREVSRGKIRIQGSVHGWFMMPRKYSYYTNKNSALGENDYPRNARRLAEDAVAEAVAHGVGFNADLDAMGDGTVTALFIVHAGRGAEKLHPLLRGSHIWSHKWTTIMPPEVGNNLSVVTYLMVPQEARLGVCVHELGHLAFQWQDFYDPNYNEDGDYWDGNGMWDVMASGSYAGDELRPVHPAGLHKLQHGWIGAEEIRATKKNVTLKPITQEDGKVLKVISPAYRDKQYLILETRMREKFDAALPGEGLLIWRVDESEEMTGSRHPGMYLVQADGQHDLLDPDDRNNGDPADPFPGTAGVGKLSDTGGISTSFPGGPRSGVSLQNITRDAESGVIQLDVTFS